MLRNKESLLISLFCSLGGRDNYLVISHKLDGDFFFQFCHNASYIMIIFHKIFLENFIF